METATTATVTGAIDTAETTTTETGIAMETEIETATAAAAAAAAVATAAMVVTEKEGGTEMIGRVTGGVGRAGTEMTALPSLSHQSVERAGGTTEITKVE